MKALEEAAYTGLDRADRCSDYDDECKDVEDHVICFCGGLILAADGTVYNTPMADGYCPFLIGMEKK